VSTEEGQLSGVSLRNYSCGGIGCILRWGAYKTEGVKKDGLKGQEKSKKVDHKVP